MEALVTLRRAFDSRWVATPELRTYSLPAERTVTLQQRWRNVASGEMVWIAVPSVVGPEG